MLPNFLVVGAMKSGTTSLYQYLRQHPDVYMSENKEPQFFSDDVVWQKGIKWYSSLFDKANGAVAIGEASTNYTKYPLFKDVPKRINDVIPDVKLIYIIRPPLERIYSHFLHSYYMGRVGNNAAEEITRNSLFLDASRYFMQVREYLAFFPKSQIKIVLLEDMKRAPYDVVKEIFTFLEVDNRFVPPNIDTPTHVTRNKQGRDNVLLKSLKKMPFYNGISNKVSERNKSHLNRIFRKKIEHKPGSFDQRTREYIASSLADDVNGLSCYLKRDLSHWLVI